MKNANAKLNPKKTKKQRDLISLLKAAETAVLELPNDVNFYVHIYVNRNETRYSFPVSIMKKLNHFEFKAEYPKKPWFWAEIEYKNFRKTLMFRSVSCKRNKKYLVFSGNDDQNFKLQIVNKMNEKFELDILVDFYFEDSVRMYEYLISK